MYTDLEATASTVCVMMSVFLVMLLLSMDHSLLLMGRFQQVTLVSTILLNQGTLTISPQVVTGLVIVNRFDSGGDRLKAVEIRAGLVPVPIEFTGLLTVNEPVGFFAGSGVTEETYFINFDRPTNAEYVTIQIIGNNGTLHLNEVTLVYEGDNNTVNNHHIAPKSIISISARKLLQRKILELSDIIQIQNSDQKIINIKENLHKNKEFCLIKNVLYKKATFLSTTASKLV